MVIENGSGYDLSGGTAWRKEADERILQNRTGNMTVTVFDAAGNCLPDANVRIKMTKHEFLFGGSINGQNFMTNATRKRQFVDLFNAGVFENYMKWRHDENNLQYSEPMLQWMLDNNIRVRGHALIWGAWINLPDLPGLPGGDAPEKLSAYENMYQDDPEALRMLTLDRINNRVPYWGDRVTEWDVLNEAWSANDVQRILGDNMNNNSTLERANITDDWFKEVRKISNERNLGLKLFYNDYALINNKGTSSINHRTWFYRFMDGLMARGVPIDGIGCQFYIQDPGTPNTAPDPKLTYELLQELEKYNLEIKVTEFGYNESDRSRQAENFIDILTAVFSHPMTTSFMIWWPWDNAGNYPNAGYFTSNNTIKPMGEAFAYLVYGKWWTDVSGKSGSDGKIGIRGYLGEYDIIVTHNGQIKIFPVKMFKNGERNFNIYF